MNRPSLTKENYALKMQYNELLHNFITLQKELKELKEQPDINQSTETYDSYKKTLHFLQNKNAELNRLLMNKPVYSNPIVNPPIVKPASANPTHAHSSTEQPSLSRSFEWEHPHPHPRPHPHPHPHPRSISPFHIYYDSPELLEAYLLTHDTDSDC